MASGYAKLPIINVFVAKAIWAEDLHGLESYTRCYMTEQSEARIRSVRRVEGV